MTNAQELKEMIYKDIESEFPDELRLIDTDSERNKKFEYVPMGCAVVLLYFDSEYIQIAVCKVNSTGSKPTWYINTKEVYNQLKDFILNEIRSQLDRLKSTVRYTKGDLMLMTYNHYWNGKTIRVYDKKLKSGHGFGIVEWKGELTLSLSTFPIRYLLAFEEEIKEILNNQSYKFSDF